MVLYLGKPSRREHKPRGKQEFFSFYSHHKVKLMKKGQSITFTYFLQYVQAHNFLYLLTPHARSIELNICLHFPSKLVLALVFHHIHNLVVH